MRERQRRAITTKIFNGLRKHGGYRLSPRSDINQVLRHLASEAGWIVDPDGTTYRSSSSSTVCAVCLLFHFIPISLLSNFGFNLSIIKVDLIFYIRITIRVHIVVLEGNPMQLRQLAAP